MGFPSDHFLAALWGHVSNGKREGQLGGRHISTRQWEGVEDNTVEGDQGSSFGSSPNSLYNHSHITPKRAHSLYP